MSKLFRIARFPILLLCCWAVARFCHHRTKGFAISKIVNNSPYLGDENSSPTPSDIDSLLQKPFRYLDRGFQSFCFVSEDGKTVLKLFSNRYRKRLDQLHLLSHISPCKGWANQWSDRYRKKWEVDFASYLLARDHFKEESGLLFFHPSPSPLPLQITLIDPIGISHPFDLSQVAFALQKKASLPYLALATAPSTEEALAMVRGLISFLQKKMEKGIADRDPLIRKNIGFIGIDPIQIDIGPLSFDPSTKNRDHQKREMIKITLPLRHWLEKNHPELVHALDEALEDI